MMHLLHLLLLISILAVYQNKSSMISVVGSTGKYILQPSLLDMHRQTLEWLSATALWKRELSFFQKLLDKHAVTLSSVEFKKQVDHFQNLITYYNGELIDILRKKLRDHESKLAHMLQALKESDTEYFSEHRGIMDELDAFQNTFHAFKHSFYEFIERGFSPY